MAWKRELVTPVREAHIAPTLTFAHFSLQNGTLGSLLDKGRRSLSGFCGSGCVIVLAQHLACKNRRNILLNK